MPVTRKQLTFEELVEQGRWLLDKNDARAAHEAFMAWDRIVASWLDGHLPGSGMSAAWSALPVSNLVTGVYYSNDEGSWTLFRRAVQSRLGWLARFAGEPSEKEVVAAPARPRAPSNRVFVVHGHDGAVRESVARLLEQLDLDPVILHEQPNEGRTVIEKFEQYADVSFAVVCLTADDRGGPRNVPLEQQQPRARQNVLLELGYFLGKLGRDRVCPLYAEGVEIPSDYNGVLFVPLSGEWRYTLARELKAAGLPVDMNKL